jgi:hypothetical protein
VCSETWIPAAFFRLFGPLPNGRYRGLSARFYLGGRRADQVWAASRYPRLKDVGTVNGVTILPVKE